MYSIHLEVSLTSISPHQIHNFKQFKVWGINRLNSFLQWDSSSSNYSYQNRMYNNSQTPSTSIQSQSRWPTPIQRPNNNNYNNRGSPSPQYTNFQNYQSQNYQQRSARSNQNNSSMMSQGKSQNFSHSSKC